MSADDDIIDQMTGIKPPLPPAVAGNRLKRADPKKHLAPEKLSALAPEHILMARYMVWGISSPTRCRQLKVGLDIPLSFKDAAIAARVRVHRARTLINDQLFRSELARQLRGFRESQAPDAVRVISAVMNDPGQGLAADRTVQLKAASILSGDSGGGSGNGGTNVQINLGGDGQRLTAGIVIRMPQSAKRTPGEPEPETLELQAVAEPAHQTEFAPAPDGQLRVRRVDQE
jgi:hypothetical protein